MGVIFIIAVLFIALLFALAKWDAYEQSPHGSISILGKVSGADGVDTLKVSVIKLDQDNKITINDLATIPIERVKNVMCYETNNSIYAGGGHRVNRYFGVLHITYTNMDGIQLSPVQLRRKIK